LVSDEFRKVGPLYDLHNDIEVAVLYKGLVELDDIGVLELLVDLDLPELFIDFVAGHLGDLQTLEGVLVVALLGEVDTPEGALADLFHQAVTANYLQLEVLVPDHLC
jgi:hypothetical protein